jgi:hypothetical protein
VTERLLKEAVPVATGDKQTRGTANKDAWYHTPKSHQSVAMAFGENAGLRDSACSDWPPFPCPVSIRFVQGKYTLSLSCPVEEGGVLAVPKSLSCELRSPFALIAAVNIHCTRTMQR